MVVAEELLLIHPNQIEDDVLHNSQVKTTWEQHHQEQEQNNSTPLGSTVSNNGNIRRKRTSYYGAGNANTGSCITIRRGEWKDDDDRSNFSDGSLSSGGGAKTRQKGNKQIFHDSMVEDEVPLQQSRNSSHEETFADEEPMSFSKNKQSSQLLVEEQEQQKQKEKLVLCYSMEELTEELEGAVDALFNRVDRDVVTVKEFHRQLEDELGYPMQKKLKALVKQRLLGLLQGDIKSSVERDFDSSASEEKSVSSDEAYDDDKEEERWKRTNAKKKRQGRTKQNLLGNKKIASKRLPLKARTSKKPSLMEKRLKTVRQKQAEEEEVRKEELAGAGEIKIHEEDLRRQEAIAARFETGQEEAKMVREKHRRSLLEQLLMKKRSILSLREDDFQPKSFINDERPQESMEECTEKIGPAEDVDGTSTTSSDSSESDDSSDTELELIPPSRSSVVDELLNPSSCDGAPKCNVHRTVPVSRKCSLGSREELRKSLRSKAIHAGNTWLARELGYKTQEEHLKDCRRAESQRKDMLRKQEVRKQILISESLLKENNFLTEFIPDDENESEDDEEMQLAREVMEEKHEENHLVSNSPVLDESEAGDESLLPPDLVNGSQLVYDNVLADESQSVHHQLIDGSQLVCDDPVVADSQQESEYDESQFVPPHLMNDLQPVGIFESRKNDGSQLIRDERASEVDLMNRPTNPSVILSPKQSVDDFDSQRNQSDHSVDEATGTRVDAVVDNILSESSPKERKDRAEGWKAVLRKEAEKLKKKKKLYKGSVSGMVEEEAEEEEEDVAAGGLEDFGFGVRNKKAVDEDEDLVTEEGDLEGIVDELSDDEGDEEEGARARKILQEREEREQHKELLRRMRDGYDGRRGGIASGGARGVHRFDELVAADDRNEAKRLGLLNDDELESDEELAGNNDENVDDEDEAELIDKMLKDRFLHRTDEEMLFSENESEEENDVNEENESQNNSEEHGEVMEQLMEKRFEKNARRNRVFEIYGDSLLGSQSRIIDEDETLKNDLKCIQTITKKRNIAPSDAPSKKLFTGAQGILSIALMANMQRKKRTTFRSGKSPDRKKSVAAVAKPVSLTHVVFQSTESQHASQFDDSRWSRNCSMGATTKQNSKMAVTSSQSGNTASLWSRVSSNGFRKR